MLAFIKQFINYPSNVNVCCQYVYINMYAPIFIATLNDKFSLYLTVYKNNKAAIYNSLLKMCIQCIIESNIIGLARAWLYVYCDRRI